MTVVRGWLCVGGGSAVGDLPPGMRVSPARESEWPAWSSLPAASIFTPGQWVIVQHDMFGPAFVYVCIEVPL